MMIKFRRIIAVGILLIVGCTSQNVENVNSLRNGMTRERVTQIMGLPAQSARDGRFSEWHYCKTGMMSDQFVTVYFEGDRMTAASRHTVTGGTGDCTQFIQLGSSGRIGVPGAYGRQSGSQRSAQQPRPDLGDVLRTASDIINSTSTPSQAQPSTDV
jgi:hypothetical protein